MGIDEIFLGVIDKLDVTKKLCEKHKIPMEEVAYIRDDLNDLEVMHEVGPSICPVNAASAVKSVAQYVTKRAGGAGAVRDAAEYVIRCCLKCGDEK